MLYMHMLLFELVQKEEDGLGIKEVNEIRLNGKL